MAVMEVTVLPIGTNTTSSSAYVAAAVDIARKDPRVTWSLNSMGTTLEGDLADLYDCLRRMQENVFAQGCDRVYSVIKVDDRRDKHKTPKEKIQAVEEKLYD